MKKLLSVLLATMMAFAAVTVTTISAFAADTTVASPETTVLNIEKIGYVNGVASRLVSYYAAENDPTQITFTYTGSGELVGWEFPELTEDKEYEVVSEEGNSITVQLINGYEGRVIANAIVEENGTTGTAEETTSATGTSEATKAEKTTAKKSESSESPNTGSAAAAGIALAGAGAAVLIALRKKDTE